MVVRSFLSTILQDMELHTCCLWSEEINPIRRQQMPTFQTHNNESSYELGCVKPTAESKATKLFNM
ncbi:hypothetical protein OIU77_016112 [Salix suchowensis]|uniref:Uncharacterized protein n=1 Tax=Salix suchowensis TaxID=1278906 RepID=A0ABQ8ZJE0_9ROSI|nr:hypothetical protein OIU77_016112 [Salix suchowensis]